MEERPTLRSCKQSSWNGDTYHSVDRAVGKRHQYYRGERWNHRLFANSLCALAIQVASETIRPDTSQVPDSAHCGDDIRSWKHTSRRIQYVRLSNWWRGPTCLAGEPLQRGSPCGICFRAREPHCNTQHRQSEVQTVQGPADSPFQEEKWGAGVSPPASPRTDRHERNLGSRHRNA